MKSDVKMVLIAFGVALLVALAIYVVGVLAYVGVAHRERKIVSIATTFDAPSSFATTKLTFDWYYTKDESRVRVVVSMPEGFAYDAVDSGAVMTALAIMPTWACHLNPLSGDEYSSFAAQDVGEYVTDDNIDVPSIMYLDNNPESCGYWEVSAIDGDFTGDLYPGQSGGQNWNDDTEKYLADTIGEMSFKLMTAVDRDAWGKKFDAAPL